VANHSFLTHVLPFLVRLGLFVAAWTSAVGCGGDSGGKKLGIADGASAGEVQTLSVTPDEGGTLELKTGARIVFPAGAVDEALEVTFKRPRDSEALSLVKTVELRHRIASAPYVVTPHGKQFKREVEVVLPVEKERDPRKIKVAWLEDENDKQWKVIATPQIADGKASFRVTHFSVFVLLESQETSDGPGTGGGDLASRFLQKFEACGVLGKTGDTVPIVARTPEEQCYFDCVLALSCDTVQELWCTDPTEIGQVVSCLQECFGEYFMCDDGASIEGWGRCDGIVDCDDGSDEVGCPEGIAFTCDDGLTTIPRDFVCDVEPDCADGADEAGCEGLYFECADGSEVLPAAFVCDLIIDCADGSDEPERCAKLACDA
jgi:hypothetical protein